MTVIVLSSVVEASKKCLTHQKKLKLEASYYNWLEEQESITN